VTFTRSVVSHSSRFDREADVTSFVLVHLQAQVSQVLTLALRQRTEGRLWITLENPLEDTGLPIRLANALYDSFFGRAITSGYYRDLIDASQVTARNDLLAASAAGLLRAERKTRGRRYVPGSTLLPAVAAALGDVEPNSSAVIEELVRRTGDEMEWFEPGPEDLEPAQEPLPGMS